MINPNRCSPPQSHKIYSRFLCFAFCCCALGVFAQQKTQLPIADRLFTGYQSYFATPVRFDPTQKVKSATVNLTGVKSQFVSGSASSVTLYWNDTLIATAPLSDSDTVKVSLSIPPAYLHQSSNQLGLEISLSENGNPCATLYKKDLWFKGLPNTTIVWETEPPNYQDLLGAFGAIAHIIVHPEATKNTKLLASAVAAKARQWTGKNIGFRYTVDTTDALFVGFAKNIPTSLAIGVYDVPPMGTARFSMVRFRDSTMQKRQGMLLTAVNDKGIQQALQHVLQLQPQDLANKKEYIIEATGKTESQRNGAAHHALDDFYFSEPTQTGWKELRQYYHFTRRSLPGAYESFLLRLESQLIDLPANAKLLCTVTLNGKLWSTTVLQPQTHLQLMDTIPAKAIKAENQLEVVYSLTGEMPPCNDIGRYLTIKTNTAVSGLYGLNDPLAALQWSPPFTTEHQLRMEIAPNLELAACELAAQILETESSCNVLNRFIADSSQTGHGILVIAPEDLDSLSPFSNHITWSSQGIYIATGDRDTTFIDVQRADAAVFIDAGAQKMRTVFIIKDIISVNALRPFFNAMPGNEFFMAFWNVNGKGYWQPHVAAQPIRWKLSWYWDRYKGVIILTATILAVFIVVFNFIKARIKRKARITNS